MENVAAPTTDDALKAANIAPDKLNEVWRKWVKLAK